MPDLRDQLAALGIPAPSAIAGPVHPSMADEIAALIRASTEDLARPELLDEAIDLHERLLSETRILGARIAARGVGVIEPATKPTVKTRQMVGRWTKETGHEQHPVTVEVKCDHRLIAVDEAQSYLTCRECKALICPIWWLARFCTEVTRAQGWRMHLEQDRQDLAKEIQALKDERSKQKQALKRGSMTQAKQALRAEGSDYLIPPAPKRKRKR